MKFNEEYNQGKRKKVQFIILTTGILNSEKIFSNLGKEVHSSFTIKKFNEDANKRIKIIYFINIKKILKKKKKD